MEGKEKKAASKGIALRGCLRGRSIWKKSGIEKKDPIKGCREKIRRRGIRLILRETGKGPDILDKKKRGRKKGGDGEPKIEKKTRGRAIE